MAREAQAPAFLPLMVAGVVVAIAWHPAGWILTVLGGLGMGWVIWRGRQEEREALTIGNLSLADGRPPLQPNGSSPADRLCSVCGGELWRRQGTLTHELHGPRPWEELRQAILDRDPGSLEGYIEAYVELTWTTDAHRVDRLTRALDHDLGWAPEDLAERVHEKVRSKLRAVGAYVHVLARLDPGITEPGDGALALETLADELAQHVPDGTFPIPLARWVLEQEAARQEEVPPRVVVERGVGHGTPDAI